MNATAAYHLNEFFNGSENVDEFHPRTLYVGNLDPQVTETLLISVFSTIGPVNKCKIIHDNINEPYAFIEFTDNTSAVNALTAMNRRNLLGREMRVNWATSPGQQVKVDTSKHFHAFVGDLSPDIDNKALREAFAPFGEISDVKVIRDLQTLKSKGYGFVSFYKREDAERAIEQMNGQWLGKRTIRTNWATRRPGAGPSSHESSGGRMTFDEVMAQSSPQNTTVYVGGLTPTTTDDDVRKYFAKFGTIMDIKVFKQQGFCFVRFDSKDSAAHAIVNVTGSEINGSTVRCSWGKEGGLTASSNPMSNYGYGYSYNAPATQAYGGAQSYATSGAATAQNYGAAAANYWNQYYSAYYNPAMYQQWASYYQQQQQQQPPQGQ